MVFRRRRIRGSFCSESYAERIPCCSATPVTFWNLFTVMSTIQAVTTARIVGPLIGFRIRSMTMLI